MLFGPVSVDEAEGAVLAHALRLPGLNFKKGRILSAGDIAALRERDIAEVTVGRLEAGDEHEDAAAARLAEALHGPGLEPPKTFLGRANLHAESEGLLVVDAPAIDRFNAVHESITLATLPAFAPAIARQMVATVKIIPFAAPRACVDEALAIARERPLLRIAPFRPMRAALIQTTLPTTPDKMLDKTARITADRLEAVGGSIVGEWRCPHEAGALARTIDEAGRDHDLLLVVGASAITDRRDVLPAGITAAGGTVDHFGMPVDPGNLILMARLDGKPAIGLPGCSRSPKLNGFDWILQRLAAGIEVGSAEIMKMGVGGLLTEIPTRPQPRAGKERPKAGPRVAALILAAGQSRRMGAINKLLIEVDGRTMIRRAAEAALASSASPLVVVTGHEAEAVKAALAGLDVTFVHNPDYAEGLSTSLRAGIGALDENTDGVIVCLGDMPRVDKALMDELIAAFNPTEGRSIVVPTHKGKRGNPVLWGRQFFDEMRALKGDVGARHLIGQYAEAVVEVESAEPSALIDIDTPQALMAFRQGAS